LNLFTAVEIARQMDGPHHADHADQAFKTLKVVEEEHRDVVMLVF